MRAIALALLTLAFCFGGLRAQTISGFVLDSAANQRVTGAEVVLLQQGVVTTVLTDSTGVFRFTPSPGMFMLRIRALGYGEIMSAGQSLGEQEHLDVRVLLEPSPFAMAPIAAEAKVRRIVDRMSGFYERAKARAAGVGIFMDSVVLAKIPAATTSDLLRYLPGANVTQNSVSLRPHCSDAVYVLDGLPVIGGTATINDIVNPTDVLAIEVYKSEIGVPIDLSFALFIASGGACGLVAIWTKR